MGMTPENFAYWLQGFFEITGEISGSTPTLNAEQTKMVKDHLGYVFEHMAMSGVGQSSLSMDTIHGTSVSSTSVHGFPIAERLIC